jgi:hypothetical protein
MIVANRAGDEDQAFDIPKQQAHEVSFDGGRTSKR